MLQQPPLDRGPAAIPVSGEAAEAALGDDAVAGDDQRNGVAAAGVADGARAAAEAGGQFAVADGFTALQALQGAPDAALEAGAFEPERQVEPATGIDAVAL